MKKILVSAFACDPTKGSEFSNGWNWAKGLSEQGFDVHCLTRSINRHSLEQLDKPNNLTFHYLSLPNGLEKLYSMSTAGMYLYYILWQWLAYKKAKRISKIHVFTLAHHVSWGSFQLGSFMYRLKIPFVFGPVGGGQKAPVVFKSYFGRHWNTELRRDKISKFLLKFNPACKQMLRNAHAVIVSNKETLEMAELSGAKNIGYSFDIALQDDFFPPSLDFKCVQGDGLKLLWVGRFLPRKGLLLVLDVMNKLKQYPDITLTVVGDGEMKNEFLTKIKANSLQDSVDWKGSVPFEVVKEYYSTHDAFLFSSLRDSGGAQIFEAMAYGLPVISINLHGQSIIINDDTGFRCSVESPESAVAEMADAIVSLYKNRAKLENMSIAAFEFAKMQKWNFRITSIKNDYYPTI